MLNQDTKQRIDALFTGVNNMDSPGCALGVIHNEELIYKQGYGSANLNYGIPITPQTVFNLGSVSKQFTATCIGLLEEAGQISLVDDIGKYFPKLKLPEQVTVGNLVFMNSGLRDCYFTANFMQGLRETDYFTTDEALKIIYDMDDLIFQPGERFWYSNTNYVLLGQLVERVTGQSLSYFAHEKLFQPLGMNDTFFRDDNTSIIKNRAQGYCKYEAMHYTNKQRAKYKTTNNIHCTAHELCEITGAGQVWSTVEDLALWINNYTANQLGNGSPELIQKLITPGKLNNGKFGPYGYGLMFSKRYGCTVIFHEGGSTGFNAATYMIPEKRLSVVCLFNTNYHLMYYYKNLGIDIFEKVADIVLDMEKKTVKQIQKRKSRIDKKLAHNPSPITGGYLNPATSDIWKIALGDEGLMTDINKTVKVELTATANVNEFECCEVNAVISLEYDSASNKVQCLHVQQGDKKSTFMPFLENQLSLEELKEYEGEFTCQKLNTTYVVSIVGNGLLIQNKDRHRTYMDHFYEPSIKDFFYTHEAPHIGCYYSIQFLRDEEDMVDAFIYRDYDGDGRERYKFSRE